MISRDTWKWQMVMYALKQGNPPEVRGICVCWGTANFTGMNSYDVNGSMAVYAAAVDVNGDGFPDPGATPIVTVPVIHSATRVPLP